jgi:hypothetical protein
MKNQRASFVFPTKPRRAVLRDVHRGKTIAIMARTKMELMKERTVKMTSMS